jgi:hypothetical protein
MNRIHTIYRRSLHHMTAALQNTTLRTILPNKRKPNLTAPMTLSNEQNSSN